MADGAAVQAVRLDSNLAEARLSLGRVYQNVHWDLPSAEREYLRALGLNPRSGQAHGWYGALLTYLGKCDDAINESRTGIRIEPLDLSSQANLGNALTLCAKRYDDGIEQYGRLLEIAPEWATAHGQLGLAYLGKNQNQEATEQFRSALRLNPNNLVHAGRVAYARARMGHRDEALAVLRDLLHRLPDPTVFYPLAELHMGLGNHDAALRYLDSAVAAHEILLGPAQSVIWDPVRSDPRFQAQLRKMGTAP